MAQVGVSTEGKIFRTTFCPARSDKLDRAEVVGGQGEGRSGRADGRKVSTVLTGFPPSAV